MMQPQTWLLLIRVPACPVSRYPLTVNRQYKGIRDNRTGDNKFSCPTRHLLRYCFEVSV